MGPLETSARLVTLAVVCLCSCLAHGQTQTVDVTQSPAKRSFSVTVPASSQRQASHLLELDDTPLFRTPLVKRRFTGSSTTLDWRTAGMVPGLNYSVRVDGRATATFRLQAESTFGLPENDLSCRTLRHTWEASGRFDVGTALSGLVWAGDHWSVRPHTFLPGESLYNVEAIARPAVVAARYCGDVATLNELALYYTKMLTQTETVGSLLARRDVTEETRLRLAGTDSAARTFAASFGTDAGEGELYNAQWLYPAALLVRTVTTLPSSQQTPAMREFATSYAAFVMTDQLKRYLFQERMPALYGVSARGRVAHWKQALAGGKGAEPWDSGMSDIDVWLLAEAAEMLGANANDPALVPVSPQDRALLHGALQTGMQLLRARRTLHSDTHDFHNAPVESATYFDGEYATHPDMAYSADGGKDLPLPAERRVLPNASWDTSHMYRLAVLFRALYENRKALAGQERVEASEIHQLVNQYVYRVFNGDYVHPLFHNFFDGSDGWFRVDYNGAGFGFPPSTYCDMRNPKRACLTAGELRGWGELAFLNPDLAHLQAALIDMAFRNDADTKAFRDRYYFSGRPFQRNVVDGFDTYGGLLYGVIAENANMLRQ